MDFNLKLSFTMKIILIERVINGWIVREGWASRDNANIAVYTDIEKLQAELPALLSTASDDPKAN